MGKHFVKTSVAGEMASAFGERVMEEPQGYDPMLVGQHWGLPTRVIDFSTNAYVAGYFAARSWLDQVMKKPGGRRPRPVVWVLDGTDQRFEPNEGDPTRPPVELLDSPATADPRIEAQHGVFVVHHVGKDLPEGLAAMDQSDALRPHTLPAGQALTLLRALERAGFSDLTMFPDTEGAVKHIVAQALMDVYG